MRVTCVAVLMWLAGSGWAHGQDYYYPAPYADYSHASTAAEGALSGMARLARGAGEYNLLTSEAAINMTEAQRNYIQNRDQWTNTYFQMREANRLYRARERGPRASMEQLVRMAKAGLPKRLSPSQLDAVTGKISWPTLLRAEQYSKHRARLEELFVKRAQQGVLTAEDYLELDKTTKALLAELKARVREVPQMDYIAAKRFVQSLAYEARLPNG